MSLVRFSIVVVALAVIAQGVVLSVQSLPNPYKEIDPWGQLPAGMTQGQVVSIKVDHDGNIVVFHRGKPAILIFTPDGKLVRTIEVEMLVKAHGMRIDEKGNIWVTDADGKDGRGHQVFKLSPQGKVLLSLGTAGKSGESPDLFNGPTDVVFGKNGDVFVADGHYTNGRIVKFSRDGKFIKAWGRHGSAPGEFSMPHCLAMDSRGRLFVGDRENSRLQIFDQDGRYLEEWKQFGRCAAMYIDGRDTLYVFDNESNDKVNPGFPRGIRVGTATTGQVTAFIPDRSADPNVVQYSPNSDGVAADAAGNIYTSSMKPRATRALAKYVKQ
jgi:sugar lactone lactonase YvrE